MAQGAIAQRALDQQLTTASWGISGKQLFATCLGEMWGDNGDVLSKLYAGTGALRSEFTRTGKRTLGGLSPFPFLFFSPSSHRAVMNNIAWGGCQAWSTMC